MEEGEVTIEVVDVVVREVTTVIAMEVMLTAREVIMTVGVDTTMVVGGVMEVTRAERGEAMRAGEEEVEVTAITLEVRAEGVLNSRRGPVMRIVGSRRLTTRLQPRIAYYYFLIHFFCGVVWRPLNPDSFHF